MNRISLLFVCLLLMASSRAQDVTGDWSGLMAIKTVRLEIVFHISMADGNLRSTFDSPDQEAYGLKFDDTRFDRNELQMSARTLGIQFSGLLSANGDTITGNWYQGGGSLPLVVTRMKPGPAKAKPTGESEIILKTSSGDISGTLSLPPGKKVVPVVLIIAGSGPTDRNGNSPPSLKNKSNCYKMLATALLKNGIASVRYDKRGIAGSAAAGKSEAELRFDNFIDDARGWIDLLSKDKRFSKVIVAGHSEGSLIGMNACAGSVAAGFISVAGAGRPAEIILKEQMAGLPDSLKKQVYGIIDRLNAGDTTGNVPPELYSMFRLQIQPYMISWFRHDPCRDLSVLACPVLIIQGAMDIQVSTTDAEILGKCHPQSTVKILPGMNHVLKDCDTMDKSEQVSRIYTNPDLPLDKEFVDATVKFVKSMK